MNKRYNGDESKKDIHEKDVNIYEGHEKRQSIVARKLDGKKLIAVGIRGCAASMKSERIL